MRIDLTSQAEALRITTHAIEAAQRGTGRTTHMLADVRDGDAIICSQGEVKHLREIVRQRNIRVDVLAISATEFLSLRGNLFRGQRYTHFSHEFIRELIEQEVLDSTKRLEKKMNEINSEAHKRFDREYMDQMMAPDPILDEINYTPVKKTTTRHAAVYRPSFDKKG